MRDWQTAENIADEIEHADICLGIFGNTAKAQRVCPFKLYAYAAVGRPIITGHTQWLQNATANLHYRPFATVPVNDPEALANEIAALAENPERRCELAEYSQRFYAMGLANQIVSELFLECLQPIKA